MSLKLPLFCCLLGLLMTTQAQNLVPNPDFSTLDQCPDEPGQLERAAPWFSPNGRTTDLAHLCADSAAFSIPQNRWGDQVPLAGNGYTGIRTWLDTAIFADRQYREYLAAALTDTLRPGETYYLEFSVSPGEASRYVTDDIGMALVPNANSQSFLLPYTPVLENQPGLLLDDFDRWYRLSTRYTAQGGEGFVVIGNFKNELQTTRVFSSHVDSAFESTYLFVDNVIVRPCAGLVPKNFIRLEDTTVCAGQPVPLVVEDQVAFDSIWVAGEPISLPFSLLDSGLIEVALFYKGCEAKDTLYITHLEQPVLDVGPDTTLCEGEAFFLRPEIGRASFSWADGFMDLNRNLTQAGTYALRVDIGPCFSTDTIHVEMASLPMGRQRDTLICQESSWDIIPDRAGTVVGWENGRMEAPRKLEESGTYWLETQTQCGIVRDSFVLTVLDCACDIQVENVFTPNGDSRNDTWEVELAAGSQLRQIQIFDRWGRRVVTLGPGVMLWDGRNEQGKWMPAQVYFYVVELDCAENGQSTRKWHKGFVSLWL